MQAQKKESNYDWIRENVQIFLDENITPRVKNLLVEKGYKKIYNVYSFGYKGANDGKIFSFLRDKKFVFFTHDRKFSKMAGKYNIMVFLVKKNIPGSNQIYGDKHISNEIEQLIFNKFKPIKEMILA